MLTKWCLAMMFLFSTIPLLGQELTIRPAVPVVLIHGEEGPAAYLVVNKASSAVRAVARITCDSGPVEPAEIALNLPANGWQLVKVRVTLDPNAIGAVLECRVGSNVGRVAVRRGIDLTHLEWRRKHFPYSARWDESLASPEADDSDWVAYRPPALWADIGYTWCRVRFTLPESWRGRPLRLVMGAIDDHDTTYLNGEQIGRTQGWDAPREYLLPERLLRYGVENVLTVVVNNVHAGGGPYKPPFALLLGNEPLEWGATQQVVELSRPKPSAIGNPLPLRPMVVRDGVLYYQGGSEVALWGTNYYPQSWHQYVNMKRLGVDMKAVIREDLSHLQQMGVQVIRIHVFDREITDGEGNIVDNEHLDLLDYLVSECSRRGIYMFFTPIAWWGGPNERADSFSANTSKPGIMFVPQAREAAQNYLRQFLSRTNRYSGRAIKDEPCLVLLEVMNEPTYFVYSDLFEQAYTLQGERPEVIERDRKTFHRLWREWLERYSLPESPVFFAAFRYELMRQYIREMVEAIRSTGAKQPVAISGFGINGEEIEQAIGDSECDAITVHNYPGGWEQVNDGVNLLPLAAPLRVSRHFSNKARLAYEFDAPATNVSCYMYPALAAHFRSAEVQVACQFQYDSISTARWNTDWQAHWLNWLYTPKKTVSFMLAGEAFRGLPRGVQYREPDVELIIGQMATSFTHNQSMWVTTDTVMHARDIGEWKPLPLPQSPRRIVGTGSSPYVEYTGNGMYILERRTATTWRLLVQPDSILVGNSLRGSFTSPVAELRSVPHLFRLKIRGMERAKCYPAGKDTPLQKVDGGWLLKPGEYEIRL